MKCKKAAAPFGAAAKYVEGEERCQSHGGSP